MRIGLGLPGGAPDSLLTWARRADDGPFATLALFDRLVYDNAEPLIALTAVAAATTRIRVQTEVLLAPLREPALLAKQAATLDRISGGRLTLGLGLGPREDDYRAAGVEFRGRGKRVEQAMAVLRKVWSGQPAFDEVGAIGPAPASAGGPEVLFGAFAPAALERVARWGDGYLFAGGGPQQAEEPFRTVRESWTRAGRSGQPRLVAQANVALGPESVIGEAKRAIGDYYAFLGSYADQVVQGMLTTPAGIRDAISGFGDLGADEVILYCWSPDPDQVHRLADV